jgi:Protein of unknown function (DUF4232)
VSYLNLEINSFQRRWRMFVTFLSIWCALAVSSIQATAQMNVPKVSSCNASQLSATEDRKESEEMDGGAGNQALTISIQNRSRSPCVLQGTPGLTLSDASNRPFSTHVCSNCADYLFPRQPARTILLDPKRSAYLLVGYRTECRKAEALSFHLSNQQGSLKITVVGMVGPRLVEGLRSCGGVNITPFLAKPPVEGSLPPEN